MTNQQHPITPPPELVEQWECEYHHSTSGPDFALFISEKAARWGADQELEACCAWANATGWEGAGDSLRADRRPKPPSLKEQALAALASADGADHPVVATVITADQHDIIRRALEQLDD